jgi:DNA-binding IclR family transcriptional regulator
MNGKGLTALQLVALASRPQMEARAAARKVQKQLQKSEAYAGLVFSQIEQIRRSGFSCSRGEWVSGANAVAVPVANSSQDLIGVLSCFGPADRLSDSQLKRIQGVLSRGAQEIAQRLCA